MLGLSSSLASAVGAAPCVRHARCFVKTSNLGIGLRCRKGASIVCRIATVMYHRIQ
jgi:hypothetical protein